MCQYIYCEVWWLPGGHRSVVRALAAQATDPGFDSQLFMVASMPEVYL